MNILHLFFPSKPCFLCSAGHTGADRVVWAVRHMWRVSELGRSSLWLVCAAQHVSSLFIFTHTVSGKSMLFVYFKSTISITFESYSEKFRNDHRDHFQMAQRLFALWWWTSATASRCVYLSMLNPQCFCTLNIEFNVVRTYSQPYSLSFSGFVLLSSLLKGCVNPPLPSLL